LTIAQLPEPGDIPRIIRGEEISEKKYPKIKHLSGPVHEEYGGLLCFKD